VYIFRLKRHGASARAPAREVFATHVLQHRRCKMQTKHQPAFFCSITGEMMRDPVATAHEQTYQRAAVPAVGPRGAAGAASRAPASSGACWRAFRCGVWWCLRSLTQRVLACVRVAVEMLLSHSCRRCWCYRAAAGLHSSSKDCAAYALYLCTAGHRQTMTCVGSGALAL
jgi:hypothetical protein